MPEPALGSFSELHHVSQLLTLYLQKRFETITFGGVSWGGDFLALAPLPSDEYSGVDYVEQVMPANAGGSLTSGFIAPKLNTQVLRVLGTGYLCVRLSTWTASAAQPVRLESINVRITRYSKIGLIKTEIDKTVTVNWDNASTVEVKRSFFITLDDLDFELSPDERIAVWIAASWRARAATGYLRRYATRGESETYVQLPVIEG